MCFPAAAAPLIFGIAQAGMGGLQAIASYQSQRSIASASERAYQETRESALQQKNVEDQKAQLKMKGEMDKASQEAQNLLVRRLQAQGSTLAAGRTGQGIGGLLADAERVEGRDLGTLGMNLAYAKQDLYFNLENNFLSAQSTINQAASQREAKPSIGGLALGLAGAGLSGVSTFKEMGGDFSNPLGRTPKSKTSSTPKPPPKPV
jgi:hypothetical protein